MAGWQSPQPPSKGAPGSCSGAPPQRALFDHWVRASFRHVAVYRNNLPEQVTLYPSNGYIPLFDKEPYEARNND